MSLRLVPWNPNWLDNHKLDLKAIYLRPVFRQDEWGEPVRKLDEHGIPEWDVVGPLPIRRHNDWSKKGFRYLTLANIDSLRMAARAGTLPEGTSIADFNQHATGGPWYAKKYFEGKEGRDKQMIDQLAVDVARFGPEAVEAIRQQVDPDFVLPASLKGKAKPQKATA